MAYIVGISSGIFGAAQPQERMQYLGISNKVNYCITQGVTFTQVDVETMSEFKDPQIAIEDDTKREAWKKKISDMNIKIGFHGESQAMGGRETPIKLDSAIEEDYVRTHARLIEVLKNAGKLGAKYYLLHSSESTPFILLGKDFQPANLVDVWGRKFGKFIDSEPWIDEWMLKEGDFIWVSLLRRPLGDYMKRMEEEYVDSSEYRALVTQGMPHEQIMGAWKEKQINDLRRFFKGHVQSRQLDYGSERYAYWIIAKWMEKNQDILWVDIAVKEWERLQATGKVSADVKPSIEDAGFRESAEGIACWVPAVAAKYLWGHFNPETCPTESPVKADDPKKILEEYDMYFVIESPMAQAGMENLMRLSDPVHMCLLAGIVDFKYFRVAIDFEHVLSNYINPEDMIARMRDNDGSLIKVVHLGWPTPVIPAHMPIYVGSDQHRWIYQRLYELRQKGFIPDEDRWLIYERGGENIEESIVAIRLVVEFLKDGVEPDKLPPKFFGVAGPSAASEDYQRTIIQQHARDPIEGLLVMPEEGFTALGKAAAEKVGGKKWEKEELR